MNGFYWVFILFLYYGGIESAAEVSASGGFKQGFKLCAAFSGAVFSAGVLYYFFAGNIPVELKFMAVPLTFMLTAYGMSRMFCVPPRKILFSSLGGVLILMLPDTPSGFFYGLALGSAGFFLGSLVLYRISGPGREDVFDSMPAILIGASIISMLVELLRTL